MRCWRTSDGRLLVEAEKGVFTLLGVDGRRERTWWDGIGSVAEHLYSTTHAVEGGELRSTFTDDNTDMDDAKPTVSVDVELKGLTEAQIPDLAERLRKST